MLYNYPKMPGNGSGAVMKAGAAKVFVFIANVIVTVVYWNLQALLGRVLLICWQNDFRGCLIMCHNLHHLSYELGTLQMCNAPLLCDI